MPNPKHKHSHRRTASNKLHWTTKLPEVTETKNVGGEPLALRHSASPDGFYKGRKLPGYKEKS